jgi:hypothetical protein
MCKESDKNEIVKLLKENGFKTKWKKFQKFALKWS